MNNWFTIDQIDKETYIISEYRHWEETHCYLLNGSEHSLASAYQYSQSLCRLLVSTNNQTFGIQVARLLGYISLVHGGENNKVGFKNSDMQVWDVQYD